MVLQMGISNTLCCYCICGHLDYSVQNTNSLHYRIKFFCIPEYVVDNYKSNELQFYKVFRT